MVKPRWKFEEDQKQDLVEGLIQQLKVPKIVASLLVKRGVESYDSAKAFFRPKLKDLHDPFLMCDMHSAVDRLTRAIEREEKILIYGDYDVDGTSAVSLVYSLLLNSTSNIEYYIPDRYKEGYGVSEIGIDYAIENNFALVIALDCGIKAVKKIHRAKDNGVDFIVCDHHRPGTTLPPAVAVLDPVRDDCKYPYKGLCGCGVGFKLMHAYCLQNGLDTKPLFDSLDLVAIATAADIVPMTGENRILTYFGLEKINKLPRRGIATMLQLANKIGSVNSTDLVFTIAPRINAAGRIKSGNRAVELLTLEDQKVSKIVGMAIDGYNAVRKEIDQGITSDALAMIEEDENSASKNSTVLYNPTWHKGVVGIVASRVIEKHYKPTILLTESGGKVTGSARSVAGFDIYQAIEGCSEWLDQFGGHKYAAGLTMEPKNVPQFSDAFERQVSQLIKKEQLTPEISIDGELQFLELTPDVSGNILPKVYRLIKQFQPFGPQNLAPLFIARSVTDSGYSKIVGKDHLKLNMHQDGSSHALNGIAFFQAHHKNLVKSGQPFDIAFHLEENYWQGQTSIQLHIKDIRPA